jgi:anti-sigma28 factor (negative regulator of flagellin synthesis)
MTSHDESEREGGLDEDSEELPAIGEVIRVDKGVWRASRLEQITNTVRTGQHKVDAERLADKLLPMMEQELEKKRRGNS